MKVAIIGLPRSGTTITCSFVNSLDGASVWGEPHRGQTRFPDIPLKTRYGDVALAKTEVLAHIEEFAKEHDLSICGFKEPLDTYIPVDPIEIVQGYGSRLDKIMVTIRDPGRNFMSMLVLGHINEDQIEEYAIHYQRFADFCFVEPRAVPIVLERFVKNPVGYMSDKMGIDIPKGHSLKAYTGSGDQRAMWSREIFPSDDRPRYEHDAISGLYVDYEAILELDELQTN
jgi:hypothetical protein